MQGGDQLLERLNRAQQPHDSKHARQSEELERGGVWAVHGDEGGNDDDGVEPAGYNGT